MFPGVTAPAIITEATSFSSLIDDVVLLVIGLGLMFSVAGWVIHKTVKR